GEARRLLEAAGYGDGFTVPLDYVPGKYRGTDAVVEALVGQLGGIGVRVQPRPQSFPAFMSRIEAADTALYLSGALPGPGGASLAYNFILHSRHGGFGTANGTGYGEPQLDALLDEASGLFPARLSRNLLALAAQRIARDCPIVPLVVEFDVYAFRS